MTDGKWRNPSDIRDAVEKIEALVAEIRAKSINGNLPVSLGAVVSSTLFELKSRADDAEKAAILPAGKPPEPPAPFMAQRLTAQEKAADALLGPHASASRKARAIGRMTAAVAAAFAVMGIVAAASTRDGDSYIESTSNFEPSSVEPAVPLGDSSTTGTPFVPAWPRTQSAQPPQVSEPQVFVSQGDGAIVRPAPEDDSVAALLFSIAGLTGAGSGLAHVMSRRRMARGIDEAVQGMTMADAMGNESNAIRNARQAREASTKLLELRDWLFEEWASATAQERNMQAPKRDTPPEMGLPDQSL